MSFSACPGANLAKVFAQEMIRYRLKFQFQSQSLYDVVYNLRKVIIGQFPGSWTASKAHDDSFVY